MPIISHPSSWSLWLPYMSLGILPLATVYGLVGKTDVVLLFGILIFRNWKLALRYLQSDSLRSLFGIMMGAALVFGLAQLIKLWRMGPVRKEMLSREGPKPLFFPSRTTHTRIFPKTHSFSYSYLLVGIPIRWKGSVGGMMAADQGHRDVRDDLQAGYSGSFFYSVDAADYLERGNGYLGLEGKLRKYLESQGIDQMEYPFAYLVTAPKLFGYSFNPVSFWYLYSADRELTAMILEVNNTFDERRMYFLKATENSIASNHQLAKVTYPKESSRTEQAASASNIAKLRGERTKFTHSWTKDFHVSPFNSRKGEYSLVAHDPLYPTMNGRGRIENAITLKSSKASSKLVARIFSLGAPLDPADMTLGQKLKFLSSWWWVGFVTFPRIVREAGKLFFQKKLHVWYRPEPLKDSIGRHADATEQALETFFRKYLRYLVESATLPLIVNYKAAGLSECPNEMIMSDSAHNGSAAAKILDVRVLTPVFYSRFVYYAHDLEAFCSELTESETIWLSDPSLLPRLVLKKLQPAEPITSWTNYAYFKVIQKLRQRPPPIENPRRSIDTAKDRAAKKSDIRTFRPSAMDGYVLTRCTYDEQKSYRSQLLKLFISDLIAFGNVDVLKVELFMLKCLLGWRVACSL